MDAYAKLASLMGANPEVAIFRRFGALNAQNLLYLQAELVALEVDLKDHAHEITLLNDPLLEDYLRCWDYPNMSGEQQVNGNEAVVKHRHTVFEIRRKLGEYNEALLHQTALAGLQKPNPKELSSLRKWMESVTMGNVYLVGRDSNIWSEPDNPDLVALQARHGDDPFTVWVNDTAVHWWHRAIGKRLRITMLVYLEPGSADWSANTVVYSPGGLFRLTSLIGVALASLVPITSTVILYTISSDLVRLIVIGIFTVGFSLSIKLVTNARLIDVFTATAAFSAVQVVFVGTNGSANGNKQ